MIQQYVGKEFSGQILVEGCIIAYIFRINYLLKNSTTFLFDFRQN